MCSYPELPTSTEIGSKIYIDNGAVILEVTEIMEDGVKARVKNKCTLSNYRNMVIVGAEIALPTYTEQDAYDIAEFGLKHEVDAIAVSYCRKAEDIEIFREELG